jgi:DNA-binding CsgD family transcriptional regulator
VVRHSDDFHPDSAPFAYLVIANIPACEWHAELTADRQVMGRSVDADIRIPAKYSSVSRTHAAIWYDRGIWLQDLGSSAGTLINGIAIKPNKEFQLTLADSLWLGGVELNVVAEIHDGYVFDPHVVGEMDTRIPTDHELEANSQAQEAATSLTHAELEVVLWISRGYTGLPELTEKLFRSPHTIRAQLRSIFRKLGIHSRDEVVAWFQRNKLSKEMNRQAEKVTR